MGSRQQLLGNLISNLKLRNIKVHFFLLWRFHRSYHFWGPSRLSWFVGRVNWLIHERLFLSRIFHRKPLIVWVNIIVFTADIWALFRSKWLKKLRIYFVGVVITSGQSLDWAQWRNLVWRWLIIRERVILQSRLDFPISLDSSLMNAQRWKTSKQADLQNVVNRLFETYDSNNPTKIENLIKFFKSEHLID